MCKLMIRPASESDVVAIGDMIYRWSGWQRERAETIRKALHGASHQILVAELDGKVVGVLHQIFYLDILNAGLNSHINFLLVEEEHRGRGIGSQLLNEAIKGAKEEGCIETHVDTIYKEAAEFYRKRGFKDDGIWLEFALLSAQ